MRRVLLLVFVAVLAAIAPARAEEPICAPPDCIDLPVPVPSGLKVPENRVRILLPEGYEDGCQRYPVLYLLHGVGDSYTRWSKNTDVIAFTRNLPVIVVMPDGGGNPEAGWFSDWVDGSRQWESFHMNVLVPYIDSTFRTLGDGHRLIAGMSMGGFGALKYAARHKGTFRAAASFSGIVDTMFAFPVSGPVFTTARPYFGTPDDRIWGNQLRDEATWREHNPTDRVADLAGTALFVQSGLGAPTGPAGDNPAKAPNYGTEHVIFHMNQSFLRAAQAAGVPVTSEFTPGYHDWPYWERALHWALPQMLETVGKPAGVCPVATHAAAARGASVLGTNTTKGETLPATGGAAATVPGVALLVAALVSRRLRRAA